MVELTTQLLILKNKFGLNTLPSKAVAIPYTCGLSRLISGAVAGEHSSILGVTWDLYLLITMKNLKDTKTKILPSTTRGGKELPSSSALDSPSVLSKLATPKPASAINSEKCLRGFPGHSENFSFLHLKQHHGSSAKNSASPG